MEINDSAVKALAMNPAEDRKELVEAVPDRCNPLYGLTEEEIRIVKESQSKNNTNLEVR